MSNPELINKQKLCRLCQDSPDDPYTDTTAKLHEMFSLHHTVKPSRGHETWAPLKKHKDWELHKQWIKLLFNKNV